MQPQATPHSQISDRRADIRRGVRDILPILAATTPFAVIFGALAAQQAMTFPESAALSGLVYAGASQFVALEFWADPLPYWTIFFSVLAVNLRHILYSASFGRKVGHWPAPQRYLGFALLVDPTFALAELDRSPRLSAAYYFGMAVPLYFYWMATTSIGYPSEISSAGRSASGSISSSPPISSCWSSDFGSGRTPPGSFWRVRWSPSPHV